MSRSRSVLRLSALALVACFVLAGCTDTTVRPGEDRSLDQPRQHDGSATATGALSLESFPVPEKLGPGWSYSTEPSGKGKDYPVTGRPPVEADVVALMDELSPDGCPSTNPLPVPTSALEVRYAYLGAPVAVFGLSFSSHALAQGFYYLRLDDLENCIGSIGDDGRLLVREVVEIADGVALSDRFPEDEADRSTEMAILTGRAVLLLYTDRGIDAAPFDRDQRLELAAKFRD